jgi:uncharacterized pyridoxamine 5'-phosphate oxidase family protein
MFDYESVLIANPNGVLATRNGDGLATRLFKFLFTEGKKIYFCTASDALVFAQLKTHPYASFCTFPEDFSVVVSFSGRARVSDDTALKIRALNENPHLKAIYRGPANQNLRLFYIYIDEVEVYIPGKGSELYKM